MIEWKPSKTKKLSIQEMKIDSKLLVGIEKMRLIEKWDLVSIASDVLLPSESV